MGFLACVLLFLSSPTVFVFNMHLPIRMLIFFSACDYALSSVSFCFPCPCFCKKISRVGLKTCFHMLLVKGSFKVVLRIF